MKELTEFDDACDGRNKGNRSQGSAKFEVNNWVGLLLLDWAGEDWEEVDWGRGGRQQCRHDMLTLTCFSSIHMGALHNAWHITSV